MLHSPCEGREQVKNRAQRQTLLSLCFFSDMAVIRRKVLEIAFYVAHVAHVPSFFSPRPEKKQLLSEKK